LLDEEMRIKITDFGSAKLLNKDAKDRKETSGVSRTNDKLNE
jgi:serine/threonine protein kinase